MSPLVTENLDAIQRLCMNHHVKSLYVFGSASRGTLTDDSDVDLLYEFDTQGIDFSKPESAPFDYTDNFYSLLESLEKLLRRRVELIPVKELRNSCVIESINRDKKLLYTA